VSAAPVARPVAENGMPEAPRRKGRARSRRLTRSSA